MKNDPCREGYEMIGTKKKNGKEVPNCVPKEEVEEACCDDCAEPIEESAEYEGRKVTLNKPFAGDSKKKRYVYVKNENGNVIKLGFGDPNMEIKRDDPERLKAYRARHNCSDPGPKWKANYWSCKYWSSTPTSKLDEATTIHLPRKYMHAGSEMEDQVSAAIHKAAGSPKMHSIEFKFGVRFEVERDGKKDQKLTDILRKNLKEESISFQTYLEGVERDKVDLNISKEVERDKERHDRMRDQADRVDAASSKAQNRRIAQEDTVKESVSIPIYVQEAAYDGNIGMMELAKFYMKASPADKQKLQDAIKSKRFKDAWKMIEKVTGVKLKGAEFATEDVTERSVGSMFKHAVGKVVFSKEYENALKLMKDTGITAAVASKRFKGVDARKLASMAEEIEEEVAANSVAGGGVDMNPTGKAKWDKRSKFHIDHMFRRADGTKYQKKKKE